MINTFKCKWFIINILFLLFKNKIIIKILLLTVNEWINDWLIEQLIEWLKYINYIIYYI